MIRKPYPPGQTGKRRRKSFSEYGRELQEKQKLRNWYNLGENQFKKYVKEALASRTEEKKDAELSLIQKLESRFDNVVFHLGFAVSRSQARQLVSYGHFLINGKPDNFPSRQLRKGDKIALKLSSQKKAAFKDIREKLKKYQPPSWLKLNLEKLSGEVIGKLSVEESAPIAEISAIFEYYSR